MDSTEPLADFSGGERGEGPERLEDLLAQYLARLNDGERLDRARILAEQPEHGEEILEELETFLALHGGAGGKEPLGTLGGYTLRRKIGRGGMGVVYEAWQDSLDRPVALKVLPAGLSADNKAFLRFMREAKTAAQLRHRNVVGVYGMGVEQNTPYYAMEYVEGETLAQVLSRLESSPSDADTPFGRKGESRYFANLAEAFAGVADGLQHAHSSGIIHRDIKPSNLILERDLKGASSNPGTLRILDFGLAHLEGQESLTVSGELMGTVLYMSPEQAMARRIPIDNRTDIYSLGATLYEALAWRPPFQGKSYQDTLSQIIFLDPRPPRQLSPDVPRDLETIVLKCLRKDPADRYSTAEALAQDLRRFTRGDPIEARRRSWSDVARSRLWRLRRRLAIAALVVLLILAGLLWLLELRGRQMAEREARYAAIVERAVEASSTESFPERLSGGQVSNRETRSTMAAHFSVPRLREAVRDLEIAAALLPRRPEARYLMARTLWQLEDVETARAELDRLIAETPDYVPARILRARIHAAHASGQPAGSSLTDANPTDSDLAAAQRLGAAWAGRWIEAIRALESGQWKEAISAYTDIIDGGAFDSRGAEDRTLGLSLEIFAGRAIALFEAGQSEAALRDLMRAHDRWPRALLPVTLAGQIYVSGGKPEIADEWFESFYPTARDQGQAASAFADAFNRSYSEYSDYALRWFERLPRGFPRDAGCALELQNLGRYSQVLALARRRVAEEPQDSFAHVMLARAHLGLENRLEAREDIEAAIQLGRTEGGSLFFSSWVFEAFGELARCELLVRRACEVTPVMPGGRLHVGYYIAARGRPREAISYLEGQLAERPLEYGLHDVLAYALGVAGDHGARLEHARLAVELDRDDIGALNALAAALEACGDLEGAYAKYLETTRTVRRGSYPWCNAMQEIGRILEGRGDSKGAIARLVDSLEAMCLDAGRIRSVLGGIRRIASKRPELEGSTDFDRLVDVLDRQVQNEPNLAASRAALALALLHAGKKRDVARAFESARAAFDLDPRERLALEALEAACSANGDRHGAIRALELLVATGDARAADQMRLEAERSALRPDIASFASADALLEREGSVPIVSEGDSWRFFRGTSAAPSGWREPDFDDRGWEEGRSGFGYGGDDDATALDDMRGSYSSVFLRKALSIDPETALRDLRFSVRSDGGFVAWLNGQEIARVGVAPLRAELPFDAVADEIADEPLATHTFVVPIGKVRPGRNVLAIQALNCTRDSSDFSVIPALAGIRASIDGWTVPGEFERLAVDPGRRAIHAYLSGRILEGSDRAGDAISPLQEACRLAPDAPEPALALAHCLVALGRGREAEDGLRCAIERGLEGNDRVWQAWAEIALTRDATSLADVRARLPARAAKAAEGLGADLRWLVETLASEGVARIDCGSWLEAKDDRGAVWARDRFWTGKSEARPVGGGSAAWESTLALPWGSEREFKGAVGRYVVPLPNGQYTVRLWLPLLVESGEVPRRIDVEVEGDLQRADVGAAGGTDVAEVSLDGVRVTDGRLDIVLRSRSGKPSLSALEIAAAK